MDELSFEYIQRLIQLIDERGPIVFRVGENWLLVGNRDTNGFIFRSAESLNGHGIHREDLEQLKPAEMERARDILNLNDTPVYTLHGSN
jgi:hypothetical protein